MNTVMRTLGGALGAQIAATFIAGHTAHGLPTVTGFTESFVLATAFLLAGIVAAVGVPRNSRASDTTSAGTRGQPGLTSVGGHADAT